MRFQGLRVHLIGIGGCGMFGAARLLRQCGAVISGSDQHRFEGVSELVAAGANVHLYHDAKHITDDVQLVVCTAAVRDDNPELAAARSRSIPVVRYAELLGMIMTTRLGVSLAGAHGKSTTTGLTTHMFRLGGLDPSFIIGAGCDQLGGSSGVGRGRHFIVESCEYARSFLHLQPHSAAILNVDAEHLDYYRDLDDIVEAFADFAGRVSPDGYLAVNHNSPGAKKAARRARGRVETFGFGPGADWRAVNLRSNRGCYRFRLVYHGQTITECTLKLAGLHNVGNALAAAALAHEAGVDGRAIAQALATFEGVRRRMMVRGSRNGATVIDDYAHHPTEIMATLRAVRHRFAPKRTWVVFQPHQASRTRLLIDQFANAFNDADVVLVPDIYSVRDTDEDRRAIASSTLVDRLCAVGKQSLYLPSFADVTAHLEKNLSVGDLVVTMGAGDVWKVADGLVEHTC